MRTPPSDPLSLAFSPLPGMWTRINELGRDGPFSGSQAVRDGTTVLGRIAWDLGCTATGIGIDHLMAWQGLKLQAGWQPAFAHLTLIRTAIEGASIARWLCDPTIGQDERIRRAAGVQFADWEHRDKYERGLGGRLPKRMPGSRTARQRIAALKKLLQRRKLAAISMPTATRLFGMYALPALEGQAREDAAVDGETLFRVISGMAHAKQWAIFEITELDHLVTQPTGKQSVRVEARDDLAADITALGIRLAGEAIGDLEHYGMQPVQRETPTMG